MTVVEEAPAAPEAVPAARRMRPRRVRGERPPRPPRRPPSDEPEPLTLGQATARGILLMLSALVAMFLLSVLVFGQIGYLAAQQQRTDTFQAELAAGTAPVSEGDFEDVLLADGDPVAVIDIPAMGLTATVAEGTSSAVLVGGPGHRRDTVLPGQVGVSVLMGRATAFGGPFGGIGQLTPGERFAVTTGQGEHVFEVMGTRYAGDPAPANPRAGESRLILMTARGGPLAPTGVEYVDATLVGEGMPSGARQTITATLPPQDAALATDTRTVWALVFALQFLLAAEIGAIWAMRRFGWRKAWIVFVPVLLLASLLTAGQLALLLPNLI
ncbi:sortase (surface protein transpeptidase) [Microbacterium marinum]|uniref:Sortase (Surface protein transpeptidase) n=1 Tax=Microbacterium marinum TaxID=421115 RepID=A0A7W7BRU1_9MICO|nr:class E sortase [Microbacterium marinum]MBB4667695.1 sortase (surface protein transpeptidase) [Microbacterium marinum]